MRARLFLLAGQTVALGLMMAFLVVPASSLFLDRYGAAALAYVYIAVAVAGVAVSVGLSRAQRRLSLAALAAAASWVYLAVVTAAWGVLVSFDGVWVTYALLVLFPLSIPIGFALVGAQAGRLLDVRQMKAHFPRVASGFSVGFAVGGFAAALLVSPLGGPRQLLVLDLVAAAAMVGLVVTTGRRFPAELRVAPEPAPIAASATSRGERRALLRHPLFVMIFGYQVLSAAVTQLLDFIVWERAAARYPDPTDLAQFLGVFGAVINVASVLFVVAFAGWILTRFGIGVGLLANPAAVLCLLIATSVVGSVSAPATLVFFILVCAQQVTDIALTDGTTRTSINATYQALLPHQRLQAQTAIEGAGVPIALGFVGLLLILQDALNLDVRAVVLVTILLTVIWTVMAVLAYRQYGANLRLVLSRRAWDPVALRMDDDLSRAAVESLLASGDLHDAETALDALVDADSPEVPRLVVSLLSSADPARRRLGAEVACTAHLWDSPGVPEGVEHLLGDGDRAVQLSAAAALAGRDERGQSLWMEAAGGDTASARVALEAAARCPDPFFVPHLVELGAWPSAPAELLDALVVHAEHLLPLARWMLGEPDAPRLTRRRLLSALGEAGIPGGRALLVEHLDDEDPSVAEAAARGLAAAGHRESPDTPRLARAVTSSAGRASRCFQVLSLLDDDEACESLRHALRDEIALSAQRAEVLLSLAHEPKAIAAGVAGLGADAEHDRNNALEMLEVTAGRRAARMLQAMTGAGLDDAARLRLLGEYCPLEARLLRDWLREIVVDRDRYWHEPWLQACALYALPSLLPAEAHSLAAKCVESADAVVAETARWVVGTVAPTV